MSHFTKCEMKITNLVALKRALDELGWKYTEATESQAAMVRGWHGQKIEAEISINMGQYDIGVVKNENGTYDLTADWWGIATSKGLEEEEVKNQLNARYSYQRVLIACEEQGYTMEEQKSEEDGTVQLVMRKWTSEGAEAE